MNTYSVSGSRDIVENKTVSVLMEFGKKWERDRIARNRHASS